MPKRLLCAVLLVAWGVMGACGSTRPTRQDAQPKTTLRVRNQSVLDMNIYLLTGATRARLGTAPSNATTDLTIPSQYIFGTSTLRFLADPIASNRTPVSDDIIVSPGDTVVMIITR